MNQIEAIKLEKGEILLRVTGRGEVTVAPDLLTMSFAVVATAAEARRAVEANA